MKADLKDVYSRLAEKYRAEYHMFKSDSTGKRHNKFGMTIYEAFTVVDDETARLGERSRIFGARQCNL